MATRKVKVFLIIAGLSSFEGGLSAYANWAAVPSPEYAEEAPSLSRSSSIVVPMEYNDSDEDVRDRAEDAVKNLVIEMVQAEFASSPITEGDIEIAWLAD